MFEIIQVGKTYQGVVDTSNAYRGCVCYKKGFNTSGQILLDLATDSVAAAVAMYPINKITFREDLADTDTAINKFSKGERCIFYAGGTYRTDMVVYSGNSLLQGYNYASAAANAGEWYPPTDTALYTMRSGKSVRLYPSTATGKFGYLKDTSAGTFCKQAAKLNANFELIMVVNATPKAIFTYRVKDSRIGVDYKISSSAAFA